MTEFHKVVMTKIVPRPDGTGTDHHSATDTVGHDILAAYIDDARTRWDAVDDLGITEPPTEYTVPDHLVKD